MVNDFNPRERSKRSQQPRNLDRMQPIRKSVYHRIGGPGRLFRPLRKNDRGSLSYFFIFIFLAAILLTLFVIANPLMIEIETEFFSVGSDLIEDARSKVDTESDKADDLRSALDAAIASEEDNVKNLQGFFQYAWVIIIVVVTLVIYMIGRANMQRQSGSGLI